MSWINATRAAFAAALLAVAACAQSETEGGEARVRTERLTIETRNGPVRFDVEVADDDEERTRGLMFRESLADDQGMLFDFPEPTYLSFWMYNTAISLDIIFIGEDGRILNIADHTTPYSEAPIPAAGLTRGVLEIRAGRAEELGIRPGDRVRHRIFPR
jgi:uncharacterized membrane protein (UPF0127 family)